MKTNIFINSIYESIQGEGVSLGTPCIFFRLQGCTLNCSFCDTKDRNIGEKYNIEEMVKKFPEKWVEKLRNGFHLVLTGGSPLLQQEAVVSFIRLFQEFYHIKPFIEVENECVLLPSHELIDLVDQWNNSPKLSNSGISEQKRYIPEIICTMSLMKNSWFKFVIKGRRDWKEIEENYIDKGLIEKEQIFLMPMGASRREIISTGDVVAKICLENNVRYSPREHIILWNRKIHV